tara:strand:+ start:3158 stop:4015 length:858 start_codon:yes stop_codon:yes gene_type:complete
MSNRAALFIAIVTCTNPAIAQEFDDESEIELNDHGLSWNIGGTTVEVSGNASLSFSYANGETTNSSELAATLGISREFANTVMLGAEFGASSESFLKHNPEGGAESSKPIDIVVYSETQFGTLSYGDVGNSLDELVSNVGDSADLDASAEILYVVNFDRFNFAASYEVNGMNDYVIAATYDADPLTIGVGYGAADDVGYYTISAGTGVRDLSIVTSYTGNENGKSSYGAEVGYSISEIDLGANYSFYEEKHSYGLSAAYQLDIGPVVQVGWSTSDGIGAGLSFEF